MRCDYDVLIVGGSHAGLSAAICIGRLARTALVCDDGQPRNLVSKHANNIASQDGIDPSIWRKNARQDLEKYETIKLVEDRVTSVSKIDDRFSAQFSSGKTLLFRKVILAYGVRDRIPNTPGFQELWGKAVFHCPFCHGFEVRGKRLGLVANGKFAEHMVPMLRGLSADIVLFTNGRSEVSEEFAKRLLDHKIPMIEEPIQSLQHASGSLQSVQFADRNAIARDYLFLGPIGPVQFSSPIADELGCAKNEMGFYAVSEMAQTNIGGLFVAGDIVSPFHTVIHAVSTGQMAGARAVADLLAENFVQGY